MSGGALGFGEFGLELEEVEADHLELVGELSVVGEAGDGAAGLAFGVGREVGEGLDEGVDGACLRRPASGRPVARAFYDTPDRPLEFSAQCA